MADDFVAKDGTGALLTFSAKDVGGKKVPRSVPSDETNTAYSVGNPLPVHDAAAGAAAASLATLVASIGSPGQAAMSASVPVAVAGDQSPIPTKDAGPNWTSVWGVSGVPVTTATTFSSTPVTD